MATGVQILELFQSRGCGLGSERSTMANMKTTKSFVGTAITVLKVQEEGNVEKEKGKYPKKWAHHTLVRFGWLVRRRESSTMFSLGAPE